ncbi:MAG: hypothetical protein AAB513_01360 [Patescibacteria group bacterium]
MKRKQKKDISTEDLATVIGRGFSDFGDNLHQIRISLRDLESKIISLENEMGENKDVLKKVRQDIFDVGTRFISRREFEGTHRDFRLQLNKLEMRVERLANRH